MSIATISINDFKAHFRRDFPYLPEYISTELYNKADRVYYSTTKLFYDAQVNGILNTPPGTSTKWSSVADDIEDYILDEDLDKAFLEAKVLHNEALFCTPEENCMGFLYLAAHYLVNDIKAAVSGLCGQSSFPVSSRTVGSVSESYAIPDSYAKNPQFSFLTESPYGKKYLSMILPKLIGNVTAVHGATQP